MFPGKEEPFAEIDETFPLKEGRFVEKNTHQQLIINN
jgi:hypothetical protein